MSFLRIFFLLFIWQSFYVANAAEFDQKLIKEIEDYLNNITTIKADFIQINADRSLSDGKFYLQKPGKFRWEYQDQPITIIANGKSLIYYDTELEQANYIPIEDTIASLLIKKKIIFGGELKITNLNNQEESISITLEKENQKEVEKFSFIFKKNPLQLGKIALIDATEQKIEVNFYNMEINQGKFSNSLFTVRDPRLK